MTRKCTLFSADRVKRLARALRLNNNIARHPFKRRKTAGKFYLPVVIHLPQSGEKPGHVSLGIEADDIAEVKEARGS